MLFLIFLAIFLIVGWWAIHLNNGTVCTIAFTLFVIASFIFVPDTGHFLTSSWGLLLSSTVAYFLVGGLFAWIDMRTWLRDVAEAAKSLISENKKIDSLTILSRMEAKFGGIARQIEYPFYTYPPDLTKTAARDMVLRRAVWWPFCLVDSLLTDWIVRIWESICGYILGSIQCFAESTLPRDPAKDEDQKSG